MDPYILLSNGGEYWFDEPSQDCFTIEVIAASLSKQCRFTGHVSRFYSIAEHSVQVSYLVPAEDALEALLHDASETFVADIPSPLKRLLTDYAAIEDRAHRAVAEKFDLRYPWPPSVKVADLVMLATEKRDLMPFTSKRWPILDGVEPRAEKIPRYSSDGYPAHWEIIFKRRFMELAHEGRLK